jgi:hypothetical protein
MDTSFQVKVVDTTAPAWMETPTNQIIETGGQLDYSLDASDASGVSHWIVNETTHFAMTGGGRLINIVALDPGTYWVSVTVFDVYHNSRSVVLSITVTDSISPQWIETPTDQVAELGSSFTYTLQAYDYSGIDAWRLGDTVYFNVDSEGVIRNSTSLVIGDYEITVYVSDLVGNTQTATFTVTVSDNTAPIWIISPTNQGLEFGDTLELQLDAWDPSGIAGWSVDNTADFSISSEGLLTSSDDLLVGQHEITVTAFDVYGNSVSSTFYVVVRSTSAGGLSISLALTILFEVMGGVLIVLSCVFLMARRHGVAEVPDIGDGLTGYFLRGFGFNSTLRRRR